MPYTAMTDVRRRTGPALAATLLLLSPWAAQGQQPPRQPQALRTPQELPVVVAAFQRQVPQATRAASQALQTFSRLVTPANYRAMGFRRLEEAREATLGIPLLEFMVPLDRLREYNPQTSPSAIIQRVNRVIFPVLFRDSVRSSLTLANTDSVWQMHSFGAPEVIQALAPMRDELAARYQLNPRSISLVRVPALNTVFLAHAVNGEVMLTPLFNDPRFEFQSGGTLPARDAFQRMVPAARAHNGLPT